jgi:hypothetical protein
MTAAGNVRLRQWIVTLVAALFGIALGAAATGLLGRRSPAAARGIPSAAAEVADASHGDPTVERRLRALEGRLSQLHSFPAQPEMKAPIPDDAEPESKNAAISDEAAREAHLRMREEEHARLLSTFNVESRDRNWAPRVEQQLLHDFAELTRLGDSQVVSLDCRDTICIATVRWPTYGVALTQHMSFLTKPYSANCATLARMPPPEEAKTNEPYEAKIVLNFETTKDAAE